MLNWLWKIVIPLFTSTAAVGAADSLHILNIFIHYLCIIHQIVIVAKWLYEKSNKKLYQCDFIFCFYVTYLLLKQNKSSTYIQDRDFLFVNFSCPNHIFQLRYPPNN